MKRLAALLMLLSIGVFAIGCSQADQGAANGNGNGAAPDAGAPETPDTGDAPEAGSATEPADDAAPEGDAAGQPEGEAGEPAGDETE